MSATTWVTVVAYDTPFLAQLATDHLDDAGITSRLLSDSGGQMLPHLSFGSGGYRVQVAVEDEPVARELLAALPEDALEGVDIGAFEDGDGVRPRDRDDGPLPRRSLGPTARLVAVIAIPVALVATVIFLWLTWSV